MLDKLDNFIMYEPVEQVYNISAYTLQELLSKFFKKINECVDIANTSLDFLVWLKGEGLSKEVEKEIEKMYNDGRLKALIDKLAGDLNGLINSNKTELEKIINDNITNLNATLSSNKTELTNLINNNTSLINGNKTSIDNLKTTTDNNFKAINSNLDLKQNKNDTSLLTGNKTIVGGINELKNENIQINNKLPFYKEYAPIYPSGITKFDDTVQNKIIVDQNNIVTFTFCVTGGKTADNLANGVTIATLPSGVPIDKIVYGVANTETVSGARRFGMVIINPTNKNVLIYFSTDNLSNVSSIKGSISWQVNSP